MLPPPCLCGGLLQVQHILHSALDIAMRVGVSALEPSHLSGVDMLHYLGTEALEVGMAPRSSLMKPPKRHATTSTTSSTPPPSCARAHRPSLHVSVSLLCSTSPIAWPSCPAGSCRRRVLSVRRGGRLWWTLGRGWGDLHVFWHTSGDVTFWPTSSTPTSVGQVGAGEGVGWRARGETKGLSQWGRRPIGTDCSVCVPASRRGVELLGAASRAGRLCAVCAGRLL